MQDLIFKGHTVVPYNNDDGKICFTSSQLAELLEYSANKSVARLDNRSKDEFSEGMTMVVSVTTINKNN